MTLSSWNINPYHISSHISQCFCALIHKGYPLHWPWMLSGKNPKAWIFLSLRSSKSISLSLNVCYMNVQCLLDTLIYNIYIISKVRHWISSHMQYIKKMLRSYFTDHISAHKYSRSSFCTQLSRILGSFVSSGYFIFHKQHISWVRPLWICTCDLNYKSWLLTSTFF